MQTFTSIDQLLDKAHPIPFSGCFVLTKSGGHGGAYSYVTHMGRPVRAHRLAYELAIGPITGGLHVCHRCDVPACINPSHLFLGTHKENMLDKTVKGRADPKFTRLFGEGAGNSRLKEGDVLFIRESKLSAAKMARQFGVSRSYVSDIRARKYWKHI